jgi:hypothetical protein
MINFYISKLGRDERFENDTDMNFFVLQKINLNSHKKYILEQLLDNNTSDILKMNIIENDKYIFSNITNAINYHIYSYDLTAGDLYKDFMDNFD